MSVSPLCLVNQIRYLSALIWLLPDAPDFKNICSVFLF
nr:MAG TPA: hypothetical protein [Caudoviricetes sp.]